MRVLGRVAGIYRQAFRGLPRDVWLLSFVVLINRSGSMVLPFISLYLTEDRGLSLTAAGRVLAVYGLGAVAGSFLGGWLSDRIGATRTQTVSLAASGVGFLAFLLLHSPAAIAAGTFVLSAVVESLRPAAMADMAHRAPDEVQARAFALLRLAVNLGMGVGPAAGGFLALLDYRWLFVVDAVTCWLAAALMLVFLVPVEAGVDDAAEGTAAAPRSPWRDGMFLWLTLLLTLLATAFFQVFSTLPLYFRRAYGYREGTIGLLLALNAFLIVAFEMVLIHRLERRDRFLLLGLGCFLVCAGLGLMPFGSSIPFVALTIAVWTAGEMLSLPMANTIVAQRAGRKHRGRYMGLYTMSFSVAFVFAPACGTWVYDRFGADTLWHGVGLLGVVLWAGALVLRRTFRAQATPPAA